MYSYLHTVTYWVNCCTQLPALPLMLSRPPRTHLTILRYVNLQLRNWESGGHTICEAATLEFHLQRLQKTIKTCSPTEIWNADLKQNSTAWNATVECQNTLGFVALNQINGRDGTASRSRSIVIGLSDDAKRSGMECCILTESIQLKIFLNFNSGISCHIAKRWCTSVCTDIFFITVTKFPPVKNASEGWRVKDKLPAFVTLKLSL